MAPKRYVNVSGNVLFRSFAEQALIKISQHEVWHDRYSPLEREDSLKKLSAVLPLLKHNAIVHLSLRFGKDAHATLLLIDYTNREVIFWDPNGPDAIFRYGGQSESQLTMALEMFHDISAICGRLKFKFHDGMSCKSSPQMKEGVCYHRIPSRVNGGYCSSYCVTFAFLFLLSDFNYKVLDERVDKLIKNDPCAFFSLFSTLSDTCAIWLLKIQPGLKKHLLYQPGMSTDFIYKEIDLSDPATRSAYKRVVTKRSEAIPTHLLDLIGSQVKLILSQLTPVEFTHDDYEKRYKHCLAVNDELFRTNSNLRSKINTLKDLIGGR